MKGTIFHLLQKNLSGMYGGEITDKLLHARGLDGACVSLRRYSDAQLVARISALCRLESSSVRKQAVP